jgi:phenylacetate-CoA ligase
MNFFSLVMKSKGYPLLKAEVELARIQRMSSAEFMEWQQQQAWAIARFHYDHNNIYKAKVGNTFPQRWEDLPVITKKDLQQPLKQVLTNGIDLKDCYVSNTSGSSGTPFFFAKDKFAHAMTWALIANRYKQWNIDGSSKQARFYGIPKELKGYWKEKIKDITMNRVRFSVFDLSNVMLDKYVSMFERTHFTYLYGYTNALVLFARYLISRDIVLKDICKGLRLCISTSELCTPEDHVLLEKGFGIKHIREYGVSETCLMGFDTPDGKWTLTEETLYNEITDDAHTPLSPGMEGNILTTSLFNRAYPMIRYEVGDMGVFNESNQTIYRSIRSLTGRTNDTIQLPGGKIAAGLTFYYISRSILESTGVLREFIIRQTALDHFVFDVVADRELTESETQQVKEKMTLYLCPGLALTVNKVDAIDRPASGKLKHFYSQLQQ